MLLLVLSLPPYARREGGRKEEGREVEREEGREGGREGIPQSQGIGYTYM